MENHVRPYASRYEVVIRKYILSDARILSSARKSRSDSFLVSEPIRHNALILFLVDPVEISHPHSATVRLMACTRTMAKTTRKTLPRGPTGATDTLGSRTRIHSLSRALSKVLLASRVEKR